MKLTATLTVLLTLGCATAATDAPDSASGGSDALKHYIGTWDILATTGETPYATGERRVEWILGGEFARATGFVETADGANDFEIMQVLTYDRLADLYRTWSFMSNGLVTLSEMTWDADSLTMTEVTRYGDTTQRTESCFAEDGVEVWSTVNLDASGKVQSEMSGTNRRRAPDVQDASK